MRKPMNYHKNSNICSIFFHIRNCFIVAMVLMCCAMTCGLEEFRLIYVVNNSTETIYVNYAEGSDELLNPSHIQFNGFNENNKILPGETLAIEVMKIQKSSQYIYYQFLIHRQSTLDHYSIEDIKKMEMYDKRYIFTADELEQRKFQIVYPND